MKYIAYRLKDRFTVKEVELVEEFTGSSRVRVKDTGEERICPSKSLYDTIEDAERVSLERTKALGFKYRKRNVRTQIWTCSCCGYQTKSEKQITLDHITAQTKFRNEDGTMSEENWTKCWSDENLQLLCLGCNRAKADLSVEEYEDIVSNNKGKNHSKKIKKQKHHKRNRKVSHGLSVTYTDVDDIMEIAKKDSNVIDVNLFFGRKYND